LVVANIPVQLTSEVELPKQIGQFVQIHGAFIDTGRKDSYVFISFGNEPVACDINDTWRSHPGYPTDGAGLSSYPTNGQMLLLTGTLFSSEALAEKLICNGKEVKYFIRGWLSKG
jgi:hypothetical protein